MLLALAVIGAMLYAFAYVARLAQRRRLAKPAGGGRLVTIVETTHLPNAASLHVVRIGDAYAIVARSSGFIAKLGDVPPETIGNWLAARGASRSA